MMRTVVLGISLLVSLAPRRSAAAAAQPAEQPREVPPTQAPLAAGLRTLEGDYVIPNFRFASGEALPELRLHFTTLGKARRDEHGRVTNAVLLLHAHRQLGPQFSHAPLRRRAVRQRAAPRCDALLHHHAGRHRPRRFEQAERRPACTLSAVQLRRHGERAVRAADAELQRRSSAPDPRHLDGLHAHLALDGAIPGFHGCRDAARVPARADRRSQSGVARSGHGFDPHRPGSGSRASIEASPCRHCTPPPAYC